MKKSPGPQGQPVWRHAFKGTLLGQQKTMVQKISRAIMPTNTKCTISSFPRLSCRRAEQNLHLFCGSWCSSWPQLLREWICHHAYWEKTSENWKASGFFSSLPPELKNKTHTPTIVDHSRGLKNINEVLSKLNMPKQKSQASVYPLNRTSKHVRVQLSQERLSKEAIKQPLSHCSFWSWHCQGKHMEGWSGADCFQGEQQTPQLQSHSFS